MNSGKFPSDFDKNTSPKTGKSGNGGYYKPKLLKQSLPRII